MENQVPAEEDLSKNQDDETCYDSVDELSSVELCLSNFIVDNSKGSSYLSPEGSRRLAIEAVNKIKAELLDWNSSNFVMYHDMKFIKMERLGVLIDWRSRYQRALGKLKGFLLDHPVCRGSFEVVQDPQNCISYYVRMSRSGETIELQLDQNIFRQYSSDELSIVDPEDAKEIELEDDTPQAIINKLRKLLLNEGGSMSLTLLNTRTQWSAIYGKRLGSMKSWIKQLNLRGELDDIYVVDNLGPGCDKVVSSDVFPPSSTDMMMPLRSNVGHNVMYSQLYGRDAEDGTVTRSSMASTPAAAAAAASTAASIATSTSMAAPGRGRLINFPLTVRDSASGVRVSDFFHLPLLTDLTEQSYQRAMNHCLQGLIRWKEKGLLSDCWTYDTDAFKKCEWTGDAVLNAEITKTLVLNSSILFDVQGLDSRRQNAQQRLTFCLLFDELKIASLVDHPPSSWVADKWKAKGDFLEAVVGEMVLRMHDAGERGVGFGHPEREAMNRFIRTICEAALDRGSKMKSLQLRDEIDVAARRPGGGGYLMEELDRQTIGK